MPLTVLERLDCHVITPQAMLADTQIHNMREIRSLNDAVSTVADLAAV